MGVTQNQKSARTWLMGGMADGSRLTEFDRLIGDAYAHHGVFVPSSFSKRTPHTSYGLRMSCGSSRTRPRTAYTRARVARSTARRAARIDYDLHLAQVSCPCCMCAPGYSDRSQRERKTPQTRLTCAPLTPVRWADTSSACVHGPSFFELDRRTTLAAKVMRACVRAAKSSPQGLTMYLGAPTKDHTLPRRWVRPPLRRCARRFEMTMSRMSSSIQRLTLK